MFPKKIHYYFFAAVSLIQVVPAADLENPNNINVTIAEKTLEKAEATFSISSIQELNFVLYVYELNHNYGEALKLLEKYEKLFQIRLEFNQRRAFYYTKMDRPQDAREIYKSLLGDLKQENWNFLIKYLESYHDADKKIPAEGYEMAKDILHTAETTAISGPQRLVHLGYIHIAVHEYLDSPSAEREKELYRLFENYLELFGQKPVCFRDVRLYLSQLSPEFSKQVVNTFNEKMREDQVELSVKHICKWITLQQLDTMFGDGSPTSLPDVEASVEKLFALNTESWKYSTGESVTESERHYADDLLLLAAHRYLELYVRTNDVVEQKSHLVSALSVLLYALRDGNLNFHLKVQAIRVYCLLGAYAPAHALYKSLEIKYIQNDTFSHVVLADSLNLNVLGCSVLAPMDRFYQDSLKELPDLITYPYRHQSYAKAREFRNFHDKLANTFQRAVHAVEHGLAQLLYTKLTPSDVLLHLNKYKHQVVVSEEKVNQLFHTADNSFWDGWHSMSSLASPFITNAATIRLDNEKDKNNILLLRGVSYHLLISVLELNHAETDKLISEFRRLFSLVNFDEFTKPIWDANLSLFNFAASFVQFLSILKEKSNVTEEEVVTSGSEVYQTLLKQFTEVIEQQKARLADAKQVHNAIALSNMLVMLQIWTFVILSQLANSIPKRLPKKANATTKQLHRTSRNELIELVGKIDDLIYEHKHAVENSLSVTIELGEASTVNEKLAAQLPTIQAALISSYQQSLSELLKILTTFARK